MRRSGEFNRRSFLARVVGGAVLAGGPLALLGGHARAIQVTDRDPSDPGGRGRGGGGVTDRDSGAGADPAGRGRGGAAARAGVSDNDTGAGADPPGCGRGSRPFTGITDQDRGATADPPQRGRGGASREDIYAACMRAQRGFQE